MKDRVREEFREERNQGRGIQKWVMCNGTDMTVQKMGQEGERDTLGQNNNYRERRGSEEVRGWGGDNMAPCRYRQGQQLAI